MTVLITGGSSGIGLELAKLFAKDKFRVIIVARDKLKLDAAKQELSRFGSDVITLSSDLSLKDGALNVLKFLKEEKIEVSVLINSAGFGTFGEFRNSDIDKHLEMLNVNILSLVSFNHLFLEQVPNEGGRILNIASLAAFAPSPRLATYAASKSFVKSFSEAISYELKKSHVQVSTLCPPAVDTGFAKRAKMEKSKLFSKSNVMSSAYVAKYAYNRFMAGETLIIPGKKYKLYTYLVKFIPLRFVEKFINSNL